MVTWFQNGFQHTTSFICVDCNNLDNYWKVRFHILFTETVNDAEIHLYLLARDPVRIPARLYISWKWFRSATVPQSKQWAYKSEVWYLLTIFFCPIMNYFPTRLQTRQIALHIVWEDKRIQNTWHKCLYNVKNKASRWISFPFALQTKFLPSKQKENNRWEFFEAIGPSAVKTAVQIRIHISGHFLTTGKINNFCVYPRGKNELSFLMWRNSSSYDVCTTQHSIPVP
jgi:hypothetical protein